MIKALKFIRNVILAIIMVVYFTFIIIISTLMLNKNEYGVTQFDDTALILVDEKISNENYKEGTLVIVKTKELKELKAGDEVFIYQPDREKRTINIVVSNVAEVFSDVASPYITITNNGSAWGEKFIAGSKVKTYEGLGGFLIFIQSKWIFFLLLITPCFFILLYEIYLLIIAIKFDEVADEIDEADKIEQLAKQLAELKKGQTGAEEQKDEKLDDLMAQLESLRKEYDKIEENNTVEEIKDVEVVDTATEKVVEETSEPKEDMKEEVVSEQVAIIEEEVTPVIEPVVEIIPDVEETVILKAIENVTEENNDEQITIEQPKEILKNEEVEIKKDEISKAIDNITNEIDETVYFDDSDDEDGIEVVYLDEEDEDDEEETSESLTDNKKDNNRNRNYKPNYKKNNYKQNYKNNRNNNNRNNNNRNNNRNNNQKRK